MTWVATAIVGSAVVGASASKSAAKTQAGAAGQAADIQQQQYEQTRDSRVILENIKTLDEDPHNL
jgi:hypothetical protein